MEEYAQMEYDQKQNYKDAEDKLLAQGVHNNMSFFAFTATPKEKTLNMFGWKDESGGYH